MRCRVSALAHGVKAMQDNTHSIFPCRPVMTEKEAATYTGFSVRTMQDWRFRGVGPSYIKIGRSVRYRLSELDTFLSGTLVTPYNVGA